MTTECLHKERFLTVSPDTSGTKGNLKRNTGNILNRYREIFLYFMSSFFTWTLKSHCWCLPTHNVNINPFTSSSSHLENKHDHPSAFLSFSTPTHLCHCLWAYAYRCLGYMPATHTHTYFFSIKPTWQPAAWHVTNEQRWKKNPFLFWFSIILCLKFSVS